MSYYTNYIGYKQTASVGTTLVPIVTGEPISSAIATVLATAFASWNDWFPGKANPNDWKGWNDNDATYWILTDGDSIENEALNILQFINAYGIDKVLVYNKSYNKTITFQDLVSKLRRGGYNKEADFILTKISANTNPIQAVSNILSNVTKSTSSLLLYAGIGLGLFLILKKKK